MQVLVLLCKVTIGCYKYMLEKKSGFGGRKRMKMKIDKKYSLYERSVQNPENDIEFINEKFFEIRGKRPLSLREDFGGTGYLCCEWVKQGAKHTAAVIDLDPEPIRYGIKGHWERLKKGKKRVSYRELNVLNATSVRADVIVAFNFSYFIFKQRQQLLEYCRKVRESLKSRGVFFMDCFGGSECYSPLEEETEHQGFDYFWDMRSFNPINNDVVYEIHFKEKGRPKQKRVFSYDWRMWSLPEIRDILQEAGFSNTLVYWEGDSEDGEDGNGEFSPCEDVEQCESWVVYIAAY